MLANLSNTDRVLVGLDLRVARDGPMPLSWRNLRALFEPAGHALSGERYVLRLYVTGLTSRSSRAVSNLR